MCMLFGPVVKWTPPRIQLQLVQLVQPATLPMYFVRPVGVNESKVLLGAPTHTGS